MSIREGRGLRVAAMLEPVVVGWRVQPLGLGEYRIIQQTQRLDYKTLNVFDKAPQDQTTSIDVRYLLNINMCNIGNLNQKVRMFCQFRGQS